jgi:hypothetical protein
LPTHVARELEDGNWTSKLGWMADVSHRKPAAIACQRYGLPSHFFKRPARSPNPTRPPHDLPF